MTSVANNADAGAALADVKGYRPCVESKRIRDLACGPLLLGSLDRFDRHRRSAGLSFDDDVCAGKLIKLGLIALEGVDLVSADKRESCPLLHALPCALRGALTLHHVLLAAHGIRDGAGDLLTGLRLNDDRGKGK